MGCWGYNSQLALHSCHITPHAAHPQNAHNVSLDDYKIDHYNDVTIKCARRLHLIIILSHLHGDEVVSAITTIIHAIILAVIFLR